MVMQLLQQNNALSGHAPIDLTTAECSIASDYTKKKNVFRVRNSNGAECLFLAKDPVSSILFFKKIIWNWLNQC